MSMISARDLLTQQPQGVQWLLEGHLVLGGLNLLVGDAGSGKTFLALDLALGMCRRGTAWGGLAVPAGDVLYYCLDSSPRLIAQRVRDMCAWSEMPIPQGLMFDFEPCNLGDPGTFQLLQEQVRTHRYKLIVFDVLARYLQGVSENSVTSISPMLTHMRQLCTESDVAVLFIHHHNKQLSKAVEPGQQVRGSSDIFGSVDCAVSLTKSREVMHMQQAKNRLGQEAARLKFKIEVNEKGVGLNFNLPVVKPFVMPTMVDVKTEQLMDLLRKLKGDYYSRGAIEERMALTVGLASERTMDKVFAGLDGVPGLRVEFKDRVKFYGWFGE